MTFVYVAKAARSEGEGGAVIVRCYDLFSKHELPADVAASYQPFFSQLGCRNTTSAPHSENLPPLGVPTRLSTCHS